MSEQELLIEIGTEELPPKALLKLATAFAQDLESLLAKASLVHAGVEVFATPRRLALIVKALHDRQADSVIERFGPALTAAFDASGKATRAAEGFARSCGVPLAELAQTDDGKGSKLYYKAIKAGQDTQTLLPPLINEALASLPVPRRMRWGSSRVEFVRPVHWVVLLYGDEVIPATILGVPAGRLTHGHRFHHPEPITLACPAEYARKLLEPGRVIASFAARQEKIRQLVEQEGRNRGATAVIDEALLEEVTALVEWPVALTGNFDRSFLAVPREALISSMKGHQKCFYLLDQNRQILPNFITLSNLESKDPQQVIAGNEKVVRPRLADAAFFYEQDKKQTLASRREKLKTVIFQQQLGTVYEKSERVARLSRFIAAALAMDVAQSERAALLGKCDLVSSMVYEFAELQGIMGYYYALNDGEAEPVAHALNEQYLPRFAGDVLPASDIGLVLALAERIDTLVGLFGIGQPPTGSRDPFALRRAALGVLRIIIEKSLDLDLVEVIAHAIGGFADLPQREGLETAVQDFIFERLRTWYADQGIDADVFLAVAAVRPAKPLEFDQRVKAVNHFRQRPEAQALAAANKRVANILARLDQQAVPVVDKALLTEAAEQDLAETLAQLVITLEPLFRRREYTAVLDLLTGLHKPVDRFFEDVMVNTDDDAVRHNRQALLLQLRQLFLRIADISHLQTL
ncbi:MAG: glycine--tRNA ligase subunit beta [Pseudomonadales bacterium]|nr:glycine--tRNA ligase subunit beta [Pseudomonadales bacterium]